MTSTFLKSIALILMLIDHIGEFIPQAPMWLRYIGRLSLPIFFYCSAWGFHYTHDRKKYLMRLYGLSILMGVGNIVLSYFLKGGNRVYLLNNIFSTILLGCLIIYIWEAAANWRKRLLYLFLFGLEQVIVFFLCTLLTELHPIPLSYEMHYAAGTVFGSCIFTEGGILFVLYFVGVYFLKERTARLSLFTVIFSLAIVFLEACDLPRWRGPLLYLLPFAGYQCLMVLAIPFYFLYNKKRGRNLKALFYAFYPLHIWILYIIGRCLSGII